MTVIADKSRGHGEYGVENCNEVWPAGKKLEFLSLEHRFGWTVVVLWCCILNGNCWFTYLFSLPGWCFSFPSPTSRHSKWHCPAVINSTRFALLGNKPLNEVWKTWCFQTSCDDVCTNTYSNVTGTILITFAFSTRVNIDNMWLFRVIFWRHNKHDGCFIWIQNIFLIAPEEWISAAFFCFKSKYVSRDPIDSSLQNLVQYRVGFIKCSSRDSRLACLNCIIDIYWVNFCQSLLLLFLCHADRLWQIHLEVLVRTTQRKFSFPQQRQLNFILLYIDYIF